MLRHYQRALVLGFMLYTLNCWAPSTSRETPSPIMKNDWKGFVIYALNSTTSSTSSTTPSPISQNDGDAENLVIPVVEKKPSALEDRQIAYELAKQRFQHRLVSGGGAQPFVDLQHQHHPTTQSNHPVLNTIRIPKSGSSALSVTGRALAGCHPDGYPCCKGTGDPPGSCPRPDLFCPRITGCGGHKPNYGGNEPVVTTLRDPGRRLLSAFFYYPPHRPDSMEDHKWSTFQTYIQSPKYRNVLTKMLGEGDYAYTNFDANKHTVQKAKSRLCHDFAWFGLSEFPILSTLLLYETPEFAWLKPNPVVFGLPPVLTTTTTTTTKNNAALPEEDLKETSVSGLRVNTNYEYQTFLNTTFPQRNGTDLIHHHNQQDLELYAFAKRLFFVRLHKMGLVPEAQSLGIAGKEIKLFGAANLKEESCCDEVPLYDY